MRSIFKSIFFSAIFLGLTVFSFAQQNNQIFFKGALKSNRDKLYKNIVSGSINKNLSKPLSDSTEEYWKDAFNAIQLLDYKSGWIDQRLKEALSYKTSNHFFTRALLELVYSRNSNAYYNEVKKLFLDARHPVVLASAGEYLDKFARSEQLRDTLKAKATDLLLAYPSDPTIQYFLYRINKIEKDQLSIISLFRKNYLPGKVLMISIQRKNRDHPGLVLVRDTSGNFLTDSAGYFHLPQLARSINNLPGYIKHGNTPEGVFRIDGFAVSGSAFIGPTTNIQMTMPFEKHAQHFLNDALLTDSVITAEQYKNLLPVDLRDHYPLMEAYHAGKSGRNEIIAHGSTVDPRYYSASAYYPLTPTLGCLTTCELWDPQTGLRTRSDQQLLVNAVSIAGGPTGYAIVINIDDQEGPVLIGEILPYLN